MDRIKLSNTHKLFTFWFCSSVGGATVIKPRGGGRDFLSPCVGPVPLLGLTPDGIMGPLQVSDHVVLNRQTGEQVTNWDM